jgi:selenide,water dikinase
MGGVAELVLDGLVPAGCYRNRDHYAPLLRPANVAETALLPLYDPQTSGGLLMAFAPADADRFLKRAASEGCFAAAVGEVLPRGEFPLEIA